MFGNIFNIDQRKKDQEIFDKVVTHLFTQKVKCVDDKGRCVYRFNGLSCAAGCLIPDEEYNPSLEGTSINFLINDGTVLQNYKNNSEIIKKLQKIHDFMETNDKNEFDLKLLSNELIKTAVSYKLNTETLDKFVATLPKKTKKKNATETKT